MSERAGTPIKGCPGCDQGTPPIMIDEDGTLVSISGKPGRWGHGVSDYYWFCDDYADPEQPSVDWLDPARESCLIDGVRYTREGEVLTRQQEIEVWRRVEQRAGRYTLPTEMDECTCKALYALNLSCPVHAADGVPIDQHPEGGGA